MENVVNFGDIHIMHLKSILRTLVETGLPVTLNIENLIIQKKVDLKELQRRYDII